LSRALQDPEKPKIIPCYAVEMDCIHILQNKFQPVATSMTTIAIASGLCRTVWTVRTCPHRHNCPTVFPLLAGGNEGWADNKKFLFIRYNIQGGMSIGGKSHARQEPRQGEMYPALFCHYPFNFVTFKIFNFKAVLFKDVMGNSMAEKKEN